MNVKGLTSSALSDALDSMGLEGCLPGIRSRVTGTSCFGPAYTVKYKPFERKPDAFQMAGQYIDNVPQGSVLVIDNGGASTCTTWGGILTAVAKQRGLCGTGAARDISEVRAAHYPLFSSHIFMRSGKNRVFKDSEGLELCIGGVTVCPGDFIFGDDNGALVLPHQHLREIVERAHLIHKNEKALLETVLSSGVRLEDARRTFSYDTPWKPR